MSLGDCFDADNREVFKVTPGIIDAVDSYSGDTLRAKHLDLGYDNSKVGSVLHVLAEEGYLEPIQVSGVRPNLYRTTDRDLGVVRGRAEDLFLHRIDDAFVVEYADSVLSDFRDYGIYTVDRGDRRELAVLRPDYCGEMLDFLDCLNIIDDSESREVLAPDVDIRFVERYLEGFDAEDF